MSTHPRLRTGYLQPREGLLPKHVEPTDWVTVTDAHHGSVSIFSKMGGTLFCDIDGTIADPAHRRVYVASKPKNWPAFERGIPHDEPIWPIIDAVKALRHHGPDYGGWKVVMCTGRGAQNKDVTVSWLEKYGIEYDAIYTRAFKDYRRDDIVKAELLEQARSDGFDPDIVFDDRNRVVDMWRREGIPCVQVAHGDF